MSSSGAAIKVLIGSGMGCFLHICGAAARGREATSSSNARFFLRERADSDVNVNVLPRGSCSGCVPLVLHGIGARARKKKDAVVQPDATFGRLRVAKQILYKRANNSAFHNFQREITTVSVVDPRVGKRIKSREADLLVDNGPKFDNVMPNEIDDRRVENHCGFADERHDGISGHVQERAKHSFSSFLTVARTPP